ncbi:serine hydrolase domain-containing protein [Pediococcus pentosaceus]|uniref:serine hydrolase domain-containing protein n=1 Tax=Pediococcus pentosaceus TaxID=1255 RepID=UPI00223B3F5A|nr:serine hydrolase domain-containing protein [Pediococcus pentosaceus]MCT1175354.1 class A beta-lactamase-related serine hydrolase [Pediococcus pentosaceus]
MKKWMYTFIGILMFICIACYIVTLKKGDTVVSNTKTKTAITRIVDRKESGKLKKSLSKTKFSGTAVLIKNNKIVDSYVSGSATDVDKNMLTTTYEIDSLQKVLTAGLVMNQVNKGKLKLTDRVNKFIPDLPGSKYITIRELLDMNSGLSMKKMKFSGNNLSSAELLDVVIDNVRFDANTKKSGKWSYQPVNFVILSEILEEITGKSYKQLFDETYVKKLKLKQTEFAYDDNIETNRAYGYVVKENGDRIEQKPNGATIFSELGTGQVYMSAPDYYKLVASLLNGKILGTDAAKELYLPLGNGKYRAGLYTSKKPFYRYANGYGYGFESHVRISQDGKKAVVVFSNHQVSGNNGLKKKVDQLSKKFLGYK